METVNKMAGVFPQPDFKLQHFGLCDKIKKKKSTLIIYNTSMYLETALIIRKLILLLSWNISPRSSYYWILSLTSGETMDEFTFSSTEWWHYILNKNIEGGDKNYSKNFKSANFEDKLLITF